MLKSSEISKRELFDKCDPILAPVPQQHRQRPASGYSRVECATAFDRRAVCEGEVMKSVIWQVTARHIERLMRDGRNAISLETTRNFMCTCCWDFNRRGLKFTTESLQMDVRKDAAQDLIKHTM